MKALANDKRLLILEWLRDPERHFPPQRDGKGPATGLLLFIAQELGVSPPTCGEHLKVLSHACLIRGKSEEALPIVIGDIVWLGGGVILCSDVTIGENKVVGAEAVVPGDLPPNMVAVGNRAHVTRYLMQ